MDRYKMIGHFADGFHDLAVLLMPDHNILKGHNRRVEQIRNRFSKNRTWSEDRSDNRKKKTTGMIFLKFRQ